jgi:dipeptidyl aminopeptidase/acylaminoacyl peptidase
VQEDAPRLTAELIVDGALPRQPVISPDGRWVAYIVVPVGQPPERRLGALWAAAADASSPPRPLTAGTAMDSTPRWAPDSGSLFFTSDRTGSVQLHRIGLDGAAPQALPNWDGGIPGHYPLAGARLVAVIAQDEPTQEDKRRSAERDDAQVYGERVPRHRLWLLDLGTRELRLVDGLGDRHVTELAQRPDGGPLAVISWPTPDIDPSITGNELHLVDPQTGAVRDLGRVETDAHSPAWWSSDGGWHLAYLARPGELGGDAVCDLRMPAGGTAVGGTAVDGTVPAAAERRNLTEGMTVCPAGLAQTGDGPPLALFADGLDTVIYRLDPGVQRFQRLMGAGVSDWGMLVATGEAGTLEAELGGSSSSTRARDMGSRSVTISSTCSGVCARGSAAGLVIRR